MTAEQAQRGKTFELLFTFNVDLKGTSIVMDIKYRYFCEYARVSKAVHLHIASLLLLSVINGKSNLIDGTQRAQGLEVDWSLIHAEPWFPVKLNA